MNHNPYRGFIMKKTWIIGLLVLFVLISGCTSGTTTTPPAQTSTPAQQTVATPPKQTTPAAPMTATVQNIDFSFYPAEVIIARGGTVTWQQKDYDAHTVTGNGFDSGRMGQGKTFNHTFNEPGTYEYWSTLDSGMKGKVIVK